MFDLKLIREQPDRARESLRRRGQDTASIDLILTADEERRKSLADLEAVRAPRNTPAQEKGRM